MARTPKPWYWEERASWYVTIRGARRNLGADRTEAQRAFHALMSKPARSPVRYPDSVAAIIDRFLDWVQKNRAADTYVWYQSRLQHFVTRYRDLTVEDLRPIHVQEWIDSIDGAPGTKRNYARTIQRAMRWAAQMGCIEVNPIADFQKPKGGVRTTVLSSETTPTRWPRCWSHGSYQTTSLSR